MNDETKLLEYGNPYWKNNPELFSQLYWLVKNHPKSYGKKLCASHKYGYILEWLNSVVLKLADKQYTIGTKVVWILTGQIDFHKCANPMCSNKIEIGMNYSMSTPRRMYCCRICQTTDPRIRENKRLAMNSHKDDPNYFKELEQQKKASKIKKGKDPNWNNSDKAKKTIENKIKKDPDFWKNRNEKTKRTKIENGHAVNWTNPEKAIKTRREKYNGKYESDDTTAKRKQTVLTNYGYESVNQSPQVKENKRNACLKKYGVDHPMKLDSVKNSIVNSVRKRYGVDHIMQCHDIFIKSKQKYVFNEIHYDSADEIYFVIYCKDHNINLEYQPDLHFEYEYHGKIHKYYPDFKIGNTIIEIKGNQFFKKDGTMFCPYRSKKLTDEQYLELCERFEAKHQCMIKNHVTIILSRSETMNIIRQYVNEKYGKSYVKECRVVNSKHEERSEKTEGHAEDTVSDGDMA